MAVLRVADVKCPHPLAHAFVDACDEIGIKKLKDYNGQTQFGM